MTAMKFKVIQNCKSEPKEQIKRSTFQSGWIFITIWIRIDVCNLEKF